MDVPLGKALLGRFSDGEIYFRFWKRSWERNVSSCSRAMLQWTVIAGMLLMIDAFKRASAWRITAVLPYYCYARQDRKDKPRGPDLRKARRGFAGNAGAERALTLDCTAPQIQGHFDVPVDHLYGSPVLVEHFRQLNCRTDVVSPDAGGVERAAVFC